MITKELEGAFIGNDLVTIKKVAYSMSKNYPCYLYEDAFQDAALLYLQNKNKFNKEKGKSLYSYVKNRIVDKLAFERFASCYPCTFPKSYVKNKGKDGIDFNKINETWNTVDFELAKNAGVEDYYSEESKLKDIIRESILLLDDDCRTFFKLSYDIDNDFEPFCSIKDIQEITGWSQAKAYRVKQRMIDNLKGLLKEWI